MWYKFFILSCQTLKKIFDPNLWVILITWSHNKLKKSHRNFHICYNYLTSLTISIRMSTYSFMPCEVITLKYHNFISTKRHTTNFTNTFRYQIWWIKKKIQILYNPCWMLKWIKGNTSIRYIISSNEGGGLRERERGREGDRFICLTVFKYFHSISVFNKRSGSPNLWLCS